MCKIDFKNFSMSSERPALVMGIVNATPDSFFEGSRGGIERAFKLIEEGADILDIGGESTRPWGYTEVPYDEEISRVIPLVRAVRERYSPEQVRISIDTRKATVFKAAFEEGADIFNDVSALMDDNESVDLAARLEVPVVLMHQGSADSSAIKHFFEERSREVITQGIDPKNIILDPGIGFGKTNDECIEIIKNTEELCKSSFPFLMALSRKRCIGGMTGREAGERLAGTLAADMISVQKGAKIIRVHDVSAAIDTLNVMKFLQ